jgi:hypothetical protein
MRTPGSKLARTALDKLGLRAVRLYTQKRAQDRSYKIYGHFRPVDLKRLQTELTRQGARNVRSVDCIQYRTNGGVRFEY